MKTWQKTLVPFVFAAGALLSVPALADVGMRAEAAMHPRISKAIRELEDAIAYLEAAPHDFGGYKAQAITDSRTAVASLRKALAYREAKDARH